MNLTIRRTTAWLAALALVVTALVLTAPSTAQAAVAQVTTDADSGDGSFRQAVMDANDDSSIRTIRFAPGLDVSLESTVTYTGGQNLTIDGRGSSVNGTSASLPFEIDGWDRALFKSESDANITLRRIRFQDSFGSGVALFIPEDAGGTVRIWLNQVTIDGSVFHGLFVDGQAYDGYNTADVPHPDCEDPWFHDSNSSIRLTVLDSRITNNGNLPEGYYTGGDFDPDENPPDSISGCPIDYDGIRVDQGGDGSIRAVVSNTNVDGNISDALEYDETGDGSVLSTTRNSTFNDNGKTGTPDKDDGFDIDEAGKGEIRATFVNNEINDNADEGLDLDEEDEGGMTVNFVKSEAVGNFDENVKIDEADSGNLTARVVNSRVNSSEDSDGARFTEEDDGDFKVTVTGSVFTGNDGQGIRFEQAGSGNGTLRIANSDLSGNDGALDDRGGVTVTKVNVVE